jgi:hypothetical protein
LAEAVFAPCHDRSVPQKSETVATTCSNCGHFTEAAHHHRYFVSIFRTVAKLASVIRAPGNNRSVPKEREAEIIARGYGRDFAQNGDRNVTGFCRDRAETATFFPTPRKRV